MGMHVIISRVMYWFPRAAITKYNELGGLKQQKCIFLQFWRLEVQNQGAGRVGSFTWLPGKISFMPLSYYLVRAKNLWCSLACRCITSISAFIFMWCSPCVSLSSYKDTSHIGLRTHPALV